MKKNQKYLIFQVLFVLTVHLGQPTYSHAQSKSTPIVNAAFEGKVVDQVNGNPIVGATVKLQGVTHSVQTDSHGNFQFITGQKLPATVIVSFLGYQSQTVEITSPKSIIKLLPTASNLDEVVVIGYGTTKKQDVVGAITKINAGEVNKIPVASFDAQLQGKAAGLQVVANSGVPGEGIFVRVRGTTSINSSSDPLYIIDGVFLNNTSLQNANLGGRTTSPLADINPADIESIEVLKDASATAIYGSRGANGVVIVTTKQGSYGAKTKIDFNLSNGFVQADKSTLPHLASGPETAALANEWWINSGIDKPSLNQNFSNRPFRPVNEGGRGLPEEQQTYDRLDFILRNGRVQDYSLGIQGGGNKSRYYIGTGYTDQEAFFKVIDFSRANFKFNFDQQLNERIKIGITSNIARTKRNQARTGDGPQVSLWNSAVSSATYTATHDQEGVATGSDNTYVLVDNYDVNTLSLRYIGSVFAEADILPGLKFRSSFSADYNKYDENQYWNTNTSIGKANNGQATSGISENTTWINEQTLNYQKQFNSVHKITALVGNTLQHNTLNYLYAEGNGFANNSYKLISSASTRTSSQDWTAYSIASFFGRAGYQYSDKYFAEATLRADASSKFGKNNRWGYFPAFALAWRLKQEDFLKDVNWLNDLKIRTSYGITGNQSGISNFASRGLWSGGSSYADVIGSPLPGIGPQQLGNDDLKWETTAQYNVGFDAELFKNRLSITLDVYDKYTSNILLQQPIKTSSGFSQYWANVGEVSNKGYELTINSVNIQNQNFTWKSSFNISGNKNKIEKLPTQITQYTRDWVILKEGQSLNSFWLYEQLAVDPKTGNAIFDGQLEDGTVPVSARKIMHNAYPKFYGGLNNSFSYKSFDLSAALSYQFGNYTLNLERYFRERNPTSGGVFENVLNRWQKDGDITDVPRLTSIGNNYTIDQNSRYLEDASFVRLKQLSIGYTLPKPFLSKAGISNARIYFLGSNLFLWTKYTGDPESNVTSNPNAQGLGSFGTPPQPRSFQLGFNLTL